MQYQKSDKMKILDLGCGSRKYKSRNLEDEVIGLDIDKNSDADVIHNLGMFPYPFENEEFDIVHASHVLEHLDKPLEFNKEVCRILKKDGKFIIKVPHYSSATAVNFLEHKHFFNIAAFSTRWFKSFKVSSIKLNYCVFRNTLPRKLVNSFFSFFANLNPRLCERLWCYWVGGFSEIEVEMIKI